LDKAGIAYHELDNGFRWCANPAALQRICTRLGPSAVQTFFWRWFHRLPSPFTPEDVQAGYAYDLAFRQFEVSDTRVFDQPQAGRAFFEGVIRDHLDIGRPDQVVLIFDRRFTPRTPGRFRTKVVTRTHRQARHVPALAEPDERPAERIVAALVQPVGGAAYTTVWLVGSTVSCGG
jgi:hypothetical protein